MPVLLFDLDGTLVDTAPDIRRALNAVLASQGRESIGSQSLREMVGFGARSLIQQAMAATGEPVTAEHLPGLVDRFIAEYHAHVADKSRPYPLVGETLRALLAEDARMAVLTNKPHELAVALLDALDLTKYFSVVHGAGRLSYSKPDPRVVQHVLEALGNANARATMIGDSATDVATARAANITVILVSYGYTPEPAHTLGADIVVDSFADIPPAIRGLMNQSLRRET
ncbi:MAG TPA: phosphoglycolate phosphatase [Rhizomicrobium sp.]|jgi:phosphoglycolate phosphatase|nr:phosphoglycolate phosphatase [Rhizomicrobium sp.]